VRSRSSQSRSASHDRRPQSLLHLAVATLIHRRRLWQIVRIAYRKSLTATV
jgi:hypothetical protein